LSQHPPFANQRIWSILAVTTTGALVLLALTAWNNGSTHEAAEAGLFALGMIAAMAVMRHVRAEAVKARDAEHQRLLDLMTSIPDGLTLWASDGRLIACNDAFARSGKFGDGVILGRSFADLMAEAAARAIRTGMAERAELDYIAARQAKFAAADGTPHEIALPNDRTEEIRYFRATSGGKVGVHRDVTARRRAEDEAKRQRALLQEIMDALPDGVQLWGPDNRLAAFNRKAAEQRRAFVPLEIGVDYADYNRRSIASGAILDAVGSEAEFLARRLAEHANPAARTVEIRRADGSWEEMRKVATSDGGRLSLFRDVSAAKRAQAELQAQRDELAKRLAERERLMAERDNAEAASRAKSEFLAMMSHELRTPMNGVIATTGLLARTRLGDDQRLYLDTIERSAQSLLTIIDDVLDWAKLEEGRLAVDPVDCAPARIVDNVVTLLRPAADEKGLHLDLEVAERIPEFLRLDPARLRQILLNLLGNAIKFTKTGRVRVALDAARGADDGVVLRLIVEDSGIGIAPEALPRLFERFAQADGSISRRYGGTGLGLAIVKRLLDLMDGTIEVDSRPGEGSRFVVRLPVVIGARPKTNTPPRILAAPNPLRLLVAEDNAVNRMVAEHLLRELGHAADFAEDGAQAIAMARDGDYDAILMDIQMPETDGIQATRAIRALGGPRGRVKIIAVTANAMAGDREKYLAAGMNGYVSKPIDAHALATALDNSTPVDGTAALADLVAALKRETPAREAFG